jgi:hypothetical protein
MNDQSKNDGGERRMETERCLVLDPRGALGRQCAGEERVFTTARCLERAAEGGPRMVVILFGSNSNARRGGLVDFVSILKSNAKTADVAVVAVLPARHRLLIEALKMVRTDYVLIIPEKTTDSFCIGASLSKLTPLDHPGHILKAICPRLNYNAIDSQHEITLCGAYRDRMVLGGSRLRETCETSAHLSCEYFLNPRPSA